MTSTRRIPVAVVGATGTVGERIVARLARHPWFEPVEVAASERSAGGPLGELVSGEADLPPSVAGLVVRSLDDGLDAPLVLSALPSGAAREVEPRLAREGRLVVSNASAFRDDPDVPLLVPEVNPEHLDLLDRQSARWSGGIVTNPNCSVAGLVVALKPLHDAFGLEAVVVTTMQALSGAGRPGPSALDLLDNVVPWIGGEEDKMAREPRKILGRLVEGGIEDAPFAVSATCTRVPVLHGHLESVTVGLSRPASPEDAREVLAGYRGSVADLGLPSLSAPAIEVLEGVDRPQPRLDRDRGQEMTVTVGRVRPSAVHHLSFLVLSHNLGRGAAGAAVANAELALVRGRVPGAQGPPA